MAVASTDNGLSETRVGIDTGGTFTDLLVLEGGLLRMAKTLSTPAEPARSTGEALSKAGLDGRGRVATLVHGTTIATNALIERRGAAVGLITTAGFGDLLEIQRIYRPRSFDLHWVKPQHLVPRRLVREVSERVAADGTVTTPLDPADVCGAARELVAAGAGAIAVSFLFSFLNSDHERAARDALQQEFPELEVSISSEVFGQWREYERTSTCVIDAFLKPTVARYAAELTSLGDERAIAFSDGGHAKPSLRGAKRRSNPEIIGSRHPLDCFASLAMTDGGQRTP